MASIIKLKDRRTGKQNGHRAIQFIDPAKNRKTIRLGKVTQKDAESVKLKIEKLVSAKITGHVPDPETASWLAGLDDTLHQRIVAAGLAQERIPAEPVNEVQPIPLGQFFEDYIENRKHLKERSRSLIRQAKQSLVDYFGKERDIRTITAGDTENWRNWMLAEGRKNGTGYAINTVNDRTKKAKRVFAFAIKGKIIDENPFDGLSTAVTANENRMCYVTREQIDRVLAACPNDEWRLLISLCRYGGLRNPSETLILEWQDVDFDQGTILVHSPKTEHHSGKDRRLIPLYPELRELMEMQFTVTGGNGHVLTSWRDSLGKNHRTMFLKIIKRAGLKPWPRLFHNLRASRQTELQDQFPAKVVCSWMGNSERVSMNNYSMVTQDHFKRALQNALQHPTVNGGNDEQTEFQQEMTTEQQ